MKGNTDNSGPHTRSLSEAEREALFKRLHLAHMRRIYQEVAVIGAICPICTGAHVCDFAVLGSSLALLLEARSDGG